MQMQKPRAWWHAHPSWVRWLLAQQLEARQRAQSAPWSEWSVLDEIAPRIGLSIVTKTGKKIGLSSFSGVFTLRHVLYGWLASGCPVAGALH